MIVIIYLDIVNMTLMYRTLLVTLLLAATLAGCSYQPARIHPEPAVIIDDGHHGHGNGNGHFCPPGQAKKGNC